MKPITLKDMPKQYSMNHPINKSGYSVFIADLKEEAIKFFKYGLKKRMNPYMIFLRFHNLTEEDLK